MHATPDGALIDDATWEKRKSEWLPSTEDGDFIASLMKPETEAGKFASWISPPKVGIDNKPGDFEYVKIETLSAPPGSMEPRRRLRPRRKTGARREHARCLREIGALVRNERAKRGMTRKTLAQQCQTSERYLAQIELGAGNPSVLVLDAIARALDLDRGRPDAGGRGAARLRICASAG